MLDEKAIIFKVRYLYGQHGRICGGHKREGGCALPGEICRSALCYRHRKVPAHKIKSRSRQGSLYAYPRQKSIDHFKEQIRKRTRRKAPLTTGR